MTNIKLNGLNLGDQIDAVSASAAAAQSSANSAAVHADLAQDAREEAEAARDEAIEVALGPEAAALIEAGISARLARRFVVFGDSWTTPLDGVSIPVEAVSAVGGTLVKNYGVAGAFIGPTTYGSDPSKATDAQVVTAAADNTYDKNTITDVLVLAGVNNEGGFLPTVVEARQFFTAMRQYFPKARCWYVANSRKNINTGGTNDPWRLYSRLQEGASLAGFAVATYSTLWHWGGARESDSWWAAGANVHMSAPGQVAYAKRLAGFLTGESWRPRFKVTPTLHADATALVGTAVIGQNDSFIEGDTLHLRVAITGMDSLSAVSTAAFVNILQIPTHYAPMPGTYAFYPAGCRLSSGTMDFTYAMRLLDGGVVAVDARLLNNHVSYFVLNADFPIGLIKSA